MLSLVRRRLIETIAQQMRVSVDEMTGKSRLGHVMRARRAAMAALYEDGLNTPGLAVEFNCKPSTARHHLHKAGVDMRFANEKPGRKGRQKP